MTALMPLAIAQRKAFFRTPTRSMPPLRQPVSMPAWHSQSILPEDIVPIKIVTLRHASETPARCTHSYGLRGASALCGTARWQELVPPDEATCPACRTRLGRAPAIRVH